MPIKKLIHALSIIAHPDDESFLLAGTSFKFDKEGKSLGIICATRGEKGDSHLSKPMIRKQLAKVREQELKASAKILKADFVKFLNYKDGKLCDCRFEQLISQLTKIIDHYKPQLILTFGKEGISGHKDHITIGNAALSASQQAIHQPREVWRVSQPHSFIKYFNQYLDRIRVHFNHYEPSRLIGIPDKKLLKINIKKYRAKKLQALYCHKSQGLPPWMVHNFPEVRDQFLSYECFEVIKLKALPAARAGLTKS